MSYARHFSVLGELTADIARELRKVVIKIDARVVPATPKDTGQACRNWICSVDVPNVNEYVFDGGKSAGVQIALDQCISESQKITGFATVYIQNNLPYINRLNRGWSQQAGSFYIEKIIQEVAIGR